MMNYQYNGKIYYTIDPYDSNKDKFKRNYRKEKEEE